MLGKNTNIGIAGQVMSEHVAQLEKGERVLSSGKSEGEIDISPLNKWEIEEMPDGKILFRRYCNGRINASYRPVTKEVAVVWAMSLLQGFEPPRSLNRLD